MQFTIWNFGKLNVVNNGLSNRVNHELASSEGATFLLL